MIETLVLNDIRYIKRDPMYIIVFILPFILGFIYKFLAINILEIKPYSYLLQSMFILVVPMMVGMVFGLRLLDEKDEGVISVYATSPLGIKGYISYRIIQCIILALIQLIILALFGVVTKYNFILTLIIGVTLAPCIFLILGIIGKNKIQGITLLKLGGLVLMLPMLQVIAKNKFDIIFKVIPSDFILNASTSGSEIYVGILYILEIIIAIALMTNYFYKRCLKDI